MPVPLAPYPIPPVPFTPPSGVQSQLVCSGCQRLLLYAHGATSVCCAVCNAVTNVPPPGKYSTAQLERENEEFMRHVEADTRGLELLEKENSEMASRMESLESQLALQQTQVQAQVQATLQSQAELQQTQVHAHPPLAIQGVRPNSNVMHNYSKAR